MIFSLWFVQIIVRKVLMHVLCGCVVVAPHPSETDEENEAQEQAEASTKVCHHSLLNFTIVVPDVMNWVVSFLYLF